MSWRDSYLKVHPSADAFPMMDDDELAKLGEDIKKNGLREPIKLMRVSGARPYPGILGATEQEEMLLDGRNRLEAMERVGINVLESCAVKFEYVNGHRGPFDFDAVSYIISVNAHRRHLTKAKLADYIVDAVKAGEKLVQAEPVSKGGRGKKNPIKEKVLAEAKKLGIHESTAKRAIAKSEGKAPKPRKSNIFVEIVMGATKKAREASKTVRETVRDYEDENIEIDDELIRACKAVSTEWDKLAAKLIQKRAQAQTDDEAAA